ncbi:MAG: hypothetical protein IKB78_06255 [Clostridia bacterium]|nr:hypothetical protein [Clostridia bacterium]
MSLEGARRVSRFSVKRSWEKNVGFRCNQEEAAIVDTNGSGVVEYKCDAWGRHLSKTGSVASTLGTLNPFCYRGYVYDKKTEVFMSRKNLAEKLLYIPIAHIYSLWHFTKRLNYFESITVGLSLIVEAMLFSHLLPFIEPFIPDPIKTLFNGLILYLCFLGPIIVARHLQTRHDMRKQSSQLREKQRNK